MNMSLVYFDFCYVNTSRISLFSYVGCELLGVEGWSPMKENELWSWFSFDLNYERWNYLDDNDAIANVLL